jgi:hypothetical protein
VHRKLHRRDLAKILVESSKHKFSKCRSRSGAITSKTRDRNSLGFFYSANHLSLLSFVLHFAITVHLQSTFSTGKMCFFYRHRPNRIDLSRLLHKFRNSAMFIRVLWLFTTHKYRITASKRHVVLLLDLILIDYHSRETASLSQ